MSLIEDLSDPLSRLIVYLCLSLIGLKRELSPWSIQRGEKSNHFSLFLSFFVSVFLSSSFCFSLCLPFFVFPTLPILYLKSPFVLSALLLQLSYFSPPNWSFSLHSFLCLALLFLFIPWLFLSPLSSQHFRPTATSPTSSQKQLVHLKEPPGMGGVNFVCIFLQKGTKQLVQMVFFFLTNMTLLHFKKFKALQYRV